MDGFDDEDEQVASLQGSNAQLRSEVATLQKIQANQQDFINQLKVAYLGLMDQNILLQETSLQLHATIKSSQDLVFELHDRLEEKDKCIRGLQHLNQGLVRQVSELSSTKGISEDCINTFQFFVSSLASIPAFVATPEISSLHIGDSEMREKEDMLQEFTQCVSHVIPSSFDASSRALVPSIGLSQP